MLKILSLALIATGVLHNTLALLALAAGIALLFPKAGPLLLLTLALLFVIAKCGSLQP